MPANAVFGDLYAAHYDSLYGGKDYAAETSLIERAFDRFGDRAGISTVLDLGCGTGTHALMLGQRGFRVTGVDASPSMLRAAAAKAAAAGHAGTWVEGDIRSVDLEREFDAVVFMFAVLGYMVENADLSAAFQNARRHLRPGGLVAFDVWYGPAVLTHRPTDALRVIGTPRGRLIRATRCALEIRRHLCHVTFTLLDVEDGRVRGEAEETHSTRFFFPLELEHHLTLAGFELRSLTAFPTLDKDPDDQSWYVFVVAEAR
jgi:SAM-dependent methyltransferase